MVIEKVSGRNFNTQSIGKMTWQKIAISFAGVGIGECGN